MTVELMIEIIHTISIDSCLLGDNGIWGPSGHFQPRCWPARALENGLLATTLSTCGLGSHIDTDLMFFTGMLVDIAEMR